MSKRLIDTIPEVIAWYVLLVIILAGGVKYAEGWTGWQTLWWVAVTIPTVGYGDLAPKTWLGQAFGVAMLLVSYVFNIVLAARLVIWYIEDRDKFTHDEQEEILNWIRAQQQQRK